VADRGSTQLNLNRLDRARAIHSQEAKPRHTKAMAHDWAANVKKYVPSANEAAIDGIVQHFGIL
jgi:hypothetical protein